MVEPTNSLSPDLLNTLYWEQRLSSYKIGDLLDVDSRKIRYLMEKFNIPRRYGLFLSGHIPWNRKTKPPKAQLTQQYLIEKMTLENLMTFYNVGRNTVKRWLKSYDIVKRYPSHWVFNGMNEDLAYLLGAIFGDGFIPQKKPWQIVFAAKDKEFVDEYCSKLENVGLGFSISIVNSTYRVVCSSENFSHWLQSQRTSLPNLNLSQKIALLRGFFNAEGSLSKSSKGHYRIQIYNTDFKLINFVENLLLSLGFSPRIYEVKKEVANHKPHFIRGRLILAQKSLYHLYILKQSEVLGFAKTINSTIPRKRLEIKND